MSHGNILEWKKKVRGRYVAWISEGLCMTHEPMLYRLVTPSQLVSSTAK